MRANTGVITLLYTVGLACTLFIFTNVDDLVVLLGFLANSSFRLRDVVIGQYTGIGVLVAASIVASLVSLVIPDQYLGLLGILPILVGIKGLFLLFRRSDEEDDTPSSGYGKIGTVALVTIANGGDNLSVYTPVFATRDALDITVIVLVFIVLTAIWLAFAAWIVRHRAFGAPIRRFGHILVPFILIAIGVMILAESGSVLFSLFS